MNLARGRLKSVLHSGIWRPVGELLKLGKRSASCIHWTESAGMYFSALVEAEVYPLEDVWPRNSVAEVLGLLPSILAPATGKCNVCRVDWLPYIKKAKKMTEEYFDGLCLDCMDASYLPKDQDPDDEYWKKNGAKYASDSDESSLRWDRNCRIRHGQPTWYASWMGSGEHRQRLIKRASVSSHKYIDGILLLLLTKLSK
jgi:hypothetical protein